MALISRINSSVKNLIVETRCSRFSEVLLFQRMLKAYLNLSSEKTFFSKMASDFYLRTDYFFVIDQRRGCDPVCRIVVFKFFERLRCDLFVA
jgi:hypothetical protein